MNVLNKFGVGKKYRYDEEDCEHESTHTEDASCGPFTARTELVDICDDCGKDVTPSVKDRLADEDDRRTHERFDREAIEYFENKRRRK
jgi:hypothetical protein